MPVLTKEAYRRHVVARDHLDEEILEQWLSIAQQVAEVIAETIDELTLMTMGYPDNRMIVDDEFDGEGDPTVRMLDRWQDRYTSFHRDFFQSVSARED